MGGSDGGIAALVEKYGTLSINVQITFFSLLSIPIIINTCRCEAP
jgi:hypothetical protein